MSRGAWGLSDGDVAAFFAVFARVAGWLQAAPLTAGPALPARLRVALAATLALALAPAHQRVTLAELPLLLPGELLLGLAIGAVAGFLLAGIEAGGQLLGLELGLGFAGHFDPLSREEALAPRRIAACLGGLAFLGAGGLELSARALVTPLAGGRAIRRAITSALLAGDGVLLVAVRAAAPVLLAVVVTQLAMALAARAAPAMNAVSVMLALVLVVGGLVLLATAPALVREIGFEVRRSLDGVARAAGG